MLARLAALADAAAWSDVASTPTARALGARVEEVGDGRVVIHPAVDHKMLNRALGVPVGALADVAARYRAHGLTRWIVQVSETDLPEAMRRAPELGLEHFHRPWAKLARHRGDVSPIPADCAIEPALPEEAESIAALWCAGFDVPRGGAPLVAALIGRAGWEVLAAREGNAVVGLGLAFDAHGGTALEGGVTASSYRRRGIQGALMARRVTRAFARGASWVSSETGVAVPGKPNSSWHNMERCGLRPVGLFHNFVPRGAAWS